MFYVIIHANTYNRFGINFYITLLAIVLVKVADAKNSI